MSEWNDTELGKLPSRWKIMRFADCIDKVIDYRGKTPKKLNGNWSKSGYRALSAKSVKTGRIINVNAIRFVNEALYKRWMKDEIKRGDILMTSEAPLGECYFWDSDEKIVLSQRLFAIRSRKQLLNQFYLYSYLISRTFQHELNSRASGTTVQGIRQTELLNTLIVVPPMCEQDIIASINMSLSSKIDLLRRQNQTLENIAQTLFKRWFIDFEFPDENGKPYKSSGGKMVERELGKIPGGWEVDVLEGIANISIGRTPPRKEEEWFSTNPSDVKWISIKDLGNSGIYIDSTAEYLTENAVQRFNIPIIPKNTVILSFKLTVGRVSITTERMLSNEAIAHVNINSSRTSVEHMFLLLKSFNYENLGSTSSIATAINSKTIKQMEILIPTENLIQEFSKTVGSVFTKVKLNTLEIQTLTKTRDILLPKLMSGQIRVKDL